MPIYEYRCEDKECAHKFEKLVSYRDSEKKYPCPKCEHKTRRLVSQSSFALKGGGWASDGYSG